MNKYRVWLTVKGGMGMEWYDGHVDVYADNDEEASEKAKRQLKRNTFRERSLNSFRVDKVERLYR